MQFPGLRKNNLFRLKKATSSPDEVFFIEKMKICITLVATNRI